MHLLVPHFKGELNMCCLKLFFGLYKTLLLIELRENHLNDSAKFATLGP